MFVLRKFIKVLISLLLTFQKIKFVKIQLLSAHEGTMLENKQLILLAPRDSIEKIVIMNKTVKGSLSKPPGDSQGNI